LANSSWCKEEIEVRIEMESEHLPENPHPPTIFILLNEEIPNPEWIAYNKAQQDMLKAGFKWVKPSLKSNEVSDD